MERRGTVSSAPETTVTPDLVSPLPESVRPGLLEPQSLWVRGGAVVLTGLWLLVVHFVGGFFGLASPVWGWLYAALCLLPGMVGTALMFGFRRSRDALLAAVAAALVCGVGMYAEAPPDHDRIRHHAEDVGITVDGWQLVADDESGNTWCLKGCPEVGYYYLTAQSPADAVATYTALLDEAGFSGGPLDDSLGRTSDYTPVAHEIWRKGRWRVEVVVPSDAYRDSWRLRSDPDLTPVEITYHAAQ